MNFGRKGGRGSRSTPRVFGLGIEGGLENGIQRACEEQVGRGGFRDFLGPHHHFGKNKRGNGERQDRLRQRESRGYTPTGNRVPMNTPMTGPTGGGKM